MNHRPTVPEPEAVEAHYEQSVERRKSGRRLIWGILTGFVLLLMLSPVVVYLAWRSRGRALLRAELAEVKANGDPLTTSEMAAWHKVPAGTRDITAIWVAAIAPFESPAYAAACTNVPIVGTSATLPELDQALPAADEKLIRAFLANQKDKLAGLYAAAAEKGEVRYKRDFRQGIAMLLPEAQQIRGAVRALDLEFEILARDADPSPAIENIQARLAAGETLRHEPLLISMLVRVAVQGLTFADIRRLAETGKLNDDQLARLQQMVRQIDIHGQMDDAILGERAWCYHAFHHPMDYTMGNNAQATPPAPLETTDDVSRVKRPEDCAMAMHLLSEMQESAERPLAEMIETMNGFEGEMKALHGGGGMSLNRLRYALTLSLLPSLQATGYADARGEIHRDMTDVALAVRRYHLRHGKAPSSENLVPDFLPQWPTDGFDGQPLRMKVLPDSVLIYSVGKDRTDDGGMTDANSLEPDTAIEVKLPAAK